MTLRRKLIRLNFWREFAYYRATGRLIKLVEIEAKFVNQLPDDYPDIGLERASLRESTQALKILKQAVDPSRVRRTYYAIKEAVR